MKPLLRKSLNAWRAVLFDKKEAVMNWENVNWSVVILQLCPVAAQTLLMLAVLLNMRKP